MKFTWSKKRKCFQFKPIHSECEVGLMRVQVKA
jgi:hypothetical protein